MREYGVEDGIQTSRVWGVGEFLAELEFARTWKNWPKQDWQRKEGRTFQL